MKTMFLRTLSLLGAAFGFRTAAAFGIARPPAATTSSSCGSRQRLWASAPETRPDASDAIQAALEASRTYGATSPEARVAWDAVEEMDARDNSAAFAPASDVECTVDDNTSRACQEYQAKVEELQRLVTEIPKLERLKTLAEEIQAIKLRDPTAVATVTTAAGGAPAPDSPELRAALERARDVSRQAGADAPEARVAWEAVEEIASAGLGNAMGPRLDEECLVESSLQACLALEELSRVVNLQRVKEQGMADF